eukprot:scaffold7346_cov245-Pinguiococcus_pyrenoidosus.AAC.30
MAAASDLCVAVTTRASSSRRLSSKLTVATPPDSISFAVAFWITSKCTYASPLAVIRGADPVEQLVSGKVHGNCCPWGIPTGNASDADARLALAVDRAMNGVHIQDPFTLQVCTRCVDRLGHAIVSNWNMEKIPKHREARDDGKREGEIGGERERAREREKERESEREKERESCRPCP